MKKLQEKGFTLVEGLLIVLILCVIGFAGYYVWNSQKKENSDNIESTSNSTKVEDIPETEVTTEEQVDSETVSWLEFTPNSKLYTVKLPDGWSFTHQDDECDCLLDGNPSGGQGSATITKVQGGRDGGSGYSISVYDSKNIYSDLVKTDSINVNGVEVEKYIFTQTLDGQGPGPQKGDKEYTYKIPKDGKYISVTYLVVAGQPDNVDVVEKSIQTIR